MSNIDKRIMEKVLVTLPKRFESKISFLEESKDLSSISLVELMSALQAQEQRRTLRQDKVTEGAFSVHKQQSKKGKKQIYQKNKGKNGSGIDSEGSKQKNFPPCRHYKKTTHLEKYCWWRADVVCGNCK
ncbi:uncharacterized protein LOC127798544 isoform X2 [Diospyros lotus]|uniref:uncharacterized protein LOC127798544 isoform X2 n=1 Tax=Diospyros lotus TaxID=55363 RepID=UPI00225AADE0|nr:uncharacterized protein LOC127798544 isoform X2 [Diospyros lotus]